MYDIYCGRKYTVFHYQEMALRSPVELVTLFSSWELQSIYFLYQNQIASQARMQHPVSAWKWAGVRKQTDHKH